MESQNSEDSNLENASDPPSSQQSQQKEKKLFPIFQKNFKPLSLAQIEVEKIGGVKRKRSLLTKETDGHHQMTLDAGQKQIGPKYCPECDLLYSPGDFQDEEIHRKTHLRLQSAFTISLWKSSKIVFTFVNGCRIILINPKTDGKRVLNRLQDFLGWLDSELGAGYEASGKGDERIFIYVGPVGGGNRVRILGCGIMEHPNPTKITTHPIKKPTPTTSETPEPPSPTQITLGITRLWTDPTHRKKKIASKILEMMQTNSGILRVIPKNEMGILEPSEDGRAFMERFTQGEGFLYNYTF